MSASYGQKGQAVTEAVLIIAMLMLFTFTISNYFKDKELLKQLITGPWQNFSCMIQNGVWAPTQSCGLNHPNAHHRNLVLQADPAI